MIDNIKIGTRLKEARLEKNLTQSDVANAVGIATSTIARYEKGQIETLKIPVVESIARYLDVDPMWILGKNKKEKTLDERLSFIREQIKNSKVKIYSIAFSFSKSKKKNKIITNIPEDKYLLIGNGNVKELTPAEHTVLDNVLNAMESEDK